jgi:hypothetical protein
MAFDDAALSTVIVRESGRSSIPETSVMESISRGVLDPPHARGMTAVLGRRYWPSLRGARDKIAKQFCAEATKQSTSGFAARWIASLALAMTVERKGSTDLGIRSCHRIVCARSNEGMT